MPMAKKKVYEFFKVRILGCNSDVSWYRNKIGQEFSVFEEEGEPNWLFLEECANIKSGQIRPFILKRDCEILILQ